MDKQDISESIAIIILGMHRSGTSAATGALQVLGVQLGSRLYAGHEHINAKGYFEHNDIADTDDEIMLELGTCWDDVLGYPAAMWSNPLLVPYAERLQGLLRRDFGHAPVWGLKDPRVCRLLPWWLRLLEQLSITPRFLFVVRSPVAVARSLSRRDGLSEDKAHLLWLRHYLEAEAASRGYRRTFMAFDAFVNEPVAQMQRVQRNLDFAFPHQPDAVAERLSAFVSKDLQHHKKDLPPDEAESAIVALSREVEAILLSACNEPSQEPDVRLLADANARLAAMQAQWPALLVEHAQTLGNRYGKSKLFSHRALRSWSWVVGKPVRYLERLFGRVV